MTERDPRWLDIPCTFTCEPLLFVLGRMLPASKSSVGPTVADDATAAARMLATEVSRNVHVVDNRELLVMMDEPFEAVSSARAHELKPQRCIASGLALELLREPGAEPSNYTWTWLCQSLGIADGRSYGEGIVRLPGIAETRLPPGVDEIPPGTGVWIWIVGPDGARVDFVDKRKTIGRKAFASTVEIPIDDEQLSRTHASIAPFQNTWAIEDARSTGGTFYEGRKIASKCLLPGMVFELGKSKLVVLSVR